MAKPAARLTELHVCPKVDPGPKPHVGGQIVEGLGSVLINGLPAARQGDDVQCMSPEPNRVQSGAKSVRIGGRPAARLGDATAHGGRITSGSANVLIGGASTQPLEPDFDPAADAIEPTWSPLDIIGFARLGVSLLRGLAARGLGMWLATRGAKIALFERRAVIAAARRGAKDLRNFIKPHAYDHFPISRGGGRRARISRFLDDLEPEKLFEEALRSRRLNVVSKGEGGVYKLVVDMKRPIGTRGERYLQFMMRADRSAIYHASPRHSVVP